MSEPPTVYNLCRNSLFSLKKSAWHHKISNVHALFCNLRFFKQEGMALYDTVLVGDLSKFDIKYVDIECQPDKDLEELKTVVETTTKKASCAFELLMARGRSFPTKRKNRY